jgi:hypothetical protein
MECKGVIVMTTEPKDDSTDQFKDKFYVSVHFEEIWWEFIDRGDDIDEFDEWLTECELDMKRRMAEFLEAHPWVHRWDMAFDKDKDEVEVEWWGGGYSTEVIQAKERLWKEIKEELKYRYIWYLI